MKNKKVIGLLLSLTLVLGLALPGTLAVSADAESSGTEFSVGTDDVSEEKTETPFEDANNSEETLVKDESVQPDGECTCGTESETHTEGCPLYTAPAEPVPAEESVHIDTCEEGCTGEDCDCSCHELSLFERLMACETLDELFAIVDETPEAELMALTEEENAQIEAKIAALEPEPLPPVVLEECENETVISEIIYPAVNFDNVAPFGAPVEG